MIRDCNHSHIEYDNLFRYFQPHIQAAKFCVNKFLVRPMRQSLPLISLSRRIQMTSRMIVV